MTEAGARSGMTLNKRHKLHLLFWSFYSFFILVCSFLITEVSLDIIDLDMPLPARVSIWTVMVVMVLCLNKIEIPPQEIKPGLLIALSFATFVLIFSSTLKNYTFIEVGDLKLHTSLLGESYTLAWTFYLALRRLHYSFRWRKE